MERQCCTSARRTSHSQYLISENGKWRFDVDAGTEEIFFRQIGENEAITIQVCHALARAAAGESSDSNTSANVYANSSERTPDGRHGLANAQPAPFHGYVTLEARARFAAAYHRGSEDTATAWFNSLCASPPTLCTPPQFDERPEGYVKIILKPS
jgi:hypothetical protein